MVTVQNKNGTLHQIDNAFQIKPLYRKYEQNLSKFKSSNSYDSFITEIIQPFDPLSRNLGCSIKQEINSLVKWNIWKIVCHNEVMKSHMTPAYLADVFSKNKRSKDFQRAMENYAFCTGT